MSKQNTLKFKEGDKVQIQYPKKEPQKQILTIKEHMKPVTDFKVYWYVKERECAIPQDILIKAKIKK